MSGATHTIAVAVRDDDLYLLLTVVRDSRADVYANWPRDMTDPAWKPHASWHASGQYHHKAYNRKMGGHRLRQKPDSSFRGTENLVITDIGVAVAKLIGVRIQPRDFDELVEVPAATSPRSAAAQRPRPLPARSARAGLPPESRPA